MPKMYFAKQQPGIEAMLLTRENMDEAAKWCGGSVESDTKPSDPTDVYICLLFPTLNGIGKANVNEYLLRDADGRFVNMSRSTFEAQYETPTRGGIVTSRDIPGSIGSGSTHIPPAAGSGITVHIDSVPDQSGIRSSIQRAEMLKRNWGRS